MSAKTRGIRLTDEIYDRVVAQARAQGRSINEQAAYPLGLGLDADKSAVALDVSIANARLLASELDQKTDVLRRALARLGSGK